MASLEEQYDAALDLLRRVSPRNVSENVMLLCQQNEELAEELLSTVDQPLLLKKDSKDDAEYPDTALRKLEETANDAFDTYRELYYEGGHSSCYLWEQDDDLAGVALFQKQQSSSRWDSVHVFEIQGALAGGLKAKQSRRFTYRLTSSVMLEIGKATNLSGYLTRQLERELTVTEAVDHVANVGTLVEDMENKLRGLLHEVYFGKTRDIIGDIRSVEALDLVNEEKARRKAVLEAYRQKNKE